jgi:hypothetical protein
MQVFQLVDVHTMAAPVCDANEGGNGGISHDTQGSVEKHKYRVTDGLGGAAHGDGNGEPNSGTNQLAAEP